MQIWESINGVEKAERCGSLMSADSIWYTQHTGGYVRLRRCNSE